MVDLKDKTEVFKHSAISLLVSIISGVFLSTLTGYMIFFAGTNYEDYAKIAADEANSTPTAAHINNMRDIVSNSEITATLSVFMVWAFLGLLLYVLASAVFRAYKASHETLALANIDDTYGERKKAVKEVLLKVLVRISGVIGLFVLYRLVIVLLPAAAIWILWAKEIGIIASLIAMVIAFILGYILTHMLVVFARFIVLRNRVFY